MTPNATITEQEQPFDKYVVCHDENDCTEATDESVTEIHETPSQCSNPESRRGISFAPEILEYEIPNREDITDDEYHLSFYSPDEIAFMNEEQNETADRMEAGKKAKKSTPFRGLEAWTQRGQHEMNQRIFSCVDSVLNEQDKQWMKGRNSTRKIAKASKSLTKTSRNKALELAKQDEKEARKVYEEHLDENDEEEDEPHIPLRAVIRQSTIIRNKKKKAGSGKSLDGSSHSLDLGMSMHSHDSCGSDFWSLSSNSVFDKPATPTKKKRKSKKKSAAREGKSPKDTPAKTTASRRKKISKVMIV